MEVGWIFWHSKNILQVARVFLVDVQPITKIFGEVFGAQVIRLVLEMREYRILAGMLQMMKIYVSVVWHPKTGDLHSRLNFSWLKEQPPT